VIWEPDGFGSKPSSPPKCAGELVEFAAGRKCRELLEPFKPHQANSRQHAGQPSPLRPQASSSASPSHPGFQGFQLLQRFSVLNSS